MTGMPPTTSPAMRLPGCALFASLLVLAAAYPAAAHEELRRADPAEGSELSAVPEQLRLTFLNPVRLEFARLALTGPDGQVIELGELRRADPASVLVGPIRGPLVAGQYTVRWQVAGPDGHPVRGEYTFTILPDAQGLTPEGTDSLDPATEAPAPDATDEQESSIPLTTDFDSGSPLYAAVRWLTFLGLLGAIGAVAFRVVVLSNLRRARPSSGAVFRPAASAAAIRVGIGAAVLLVLALALRLYAQSYALNGPAALEPHRIAAVLGSGSWALGWWLQAASALATLAGLLLARGRKSGVRVAGWGLATLGVLVLAFTPALSGHAAAVPERTAFAVLADGLHVLAAGGWLGSLLVVVIAGLPVALRQTEDRGAGVAALINAFSPTALLFAGVLVATGVASAWLHLGSLPALWTSEYGRTLLVKLGVFLVVLGTGAYNWLRVRPEMGDPAAAHRLRRSATLELAVGVLVLAVTAVLVATPPPTDGVGP